MKQVLIWLSVSMMVVTLAWAASSIRPEPAYRACLTADDVLYYQNNSREGISLTCNETIRQRNISRRTAQ